MRQNVSECHPLIIAIAVALTPEDLHSMSRQSLELAQPPRVLASAIGVALTAFSALHCPVRAGHHCRPRRCAGRARRIDRDRRAGAKLQSRYLRFEEVHRALRETPKSVTVITDQVIRDTGSLTLVDALRTTPALPSVRVRAATRRVTGRSFAASTPRATPLSMACVMSARKPARSSTSSASR